MIDFIFGLMAGVLVGTIICGVLLIDFWRKKREDNREERKAHSRYRVFTKSA